jgi:glycosyltransferase involved in cell wall biosynthesis
LRLGLALRDIGVTIKIIVYSRAQRGRPDVSWIVDEARAQGLWVEPWADRAKLPWRDVGRLAAEITRGSFDLLVTHEHKSDLMGYLAARRAGVPWVAVAHGYDFSLLRVRLYRRIDLWLLRRAAHVMVVSPSLRDELVAGGVPWERTTIVRNGIHVDAFAAGAVERAPQWRQRMAHADGPVIVSVGRLDRQKGFEYLIRAAVEVVRAVPSARFWIVGDGGLRARLERQIESLGLGQVVRLLGHQRDVSGIMAAADLVVLASLWEPLGNVLLEAHALGRPVVATRVGGVPEIVRDGTTGLLVPPGDVAAFAQSILIMLGDPREAERMGARGRVHVAREFSAARFAAEAAAVYRKALGGEVRVPGG